MSSLQHKIDFAVILTVDRANPNGDPLNGNRPRTDYDDIGEISDVCIKRKIRDRLMEKGENIFVQADYHSKRDDYPNLKERALGILGKELFGRTAKKKGKKKKHSDQNNNAEESTIQDLSEILAAKRAVVDKACKQWVDVRAFGQLFAFKIKENDKKAQNTTEEDKSKAADSDGISIPIRGPVTIQSAFSQGKITIESNQIIKSTDNEAEEGKNARMGMKHRVNKGTYVFYGSMSPQLAERTGFSDEDAKVIKSILPQLFENDASSARPEGSMAVKKVIWWQHNCKSGQYSSARVHRTLNVNPDGTYHLQNLDGLTPEPIDGF